MPSRIPPRIPSISTERTEPLRPVTTAPVASTPTASTATASTAIASTPTASPAIASTPTASPAIASTPAAPTTTRPASPTTPASTTVAPRPDLFIDPRLPRLPPGFSAPRMDLVVPDNLGRPPTSDDITVRKGFDGRTPDEAVAQVVGNLSDALDPANRGFVERTARDTHKAFTLAVNNAFIPGSPVHQRFSQLRGTVAIVGTLSAMHPTLVEVRVSGQPPVYLARSPQGGFEPVPDMRYPIVMRAEVMWRPAGVKVDYPRWSAPQLTGPTSTIIEG